MRRTLLVIFTTMLFLAQVASAASLDYRHDYKHHTDQHSNRLKLGFEKGVVYYNFVTSFATAKNADGSQDMFGRIKDPSGRLEIGTKHSFKDNWYVRPGLRLGGGKGFHTTDAQVRIGYSFQQQPVKAYFQYRRQMKHNHSSGVKADVKNKITLLLSYSQGPNVYSLKSSLVKSERYKVFGNNKTDYDYILGYQRQFTPALSANINFADVSSGSHSKTRQWMTRAGFKYKF